MSRCVMSRHLSVLLIALLSACASVPQGSSAANFAPYDARYHELIETVKALATTAQFEELRQVYVKTSYYNPYTGSERALSQLMFEAMESQNWQACLDNANEILDTNYISINAHYGAMVCSFESGNEDAGVYHKYVLDGLVGAVWAGGNGKSMKTAFFCTGTTELYAFINLHDFKVVGQALVHNQGRSYDVMELESRGGRIFNWYFDITAQWTRGMEGVEN